MACEILNDAERFVLWVADDLSPVPAQGMPGSKSRYYGQASPEEGVDGGQESPEAHWFWRHVRSSNAVGAQLVDAILGKVEGLCREISACNGGSIRTIGKLCVALRSYCVLVSLGCQGVQASRARIALKAPFDAVRVVLSTPPLRGVETSGGIASASDVLELDRGAAKLEELVTCVVLVTACRLAGQELAREGLRACSSALRRLVALTSPPGTEACPSVLNVGRLTRDASDSDSSSDSESEHDDSDELRGMSHYCCCAGLYAALLLKGSRFRAINEAVGGVLGCAPPLSGREDLRALQALRREALAFSEAENQTFRPSPRVGPCSASELSPSLSSRVPQQPPGPGVGLMPSLSLSAPHSAGPGMSSFGRSRSRAPSTGSIASASEGGTGASAGGSMENDGLRDREAGSRLVSMRRGGWLSEVVLAQHVKRLPALGVSVFRDGVRKEQEEGKGLSTSREEEGRDGGGREGADVENGDGDGGDTLGGVTALGGFAEADWPLGVVDCVEEALEQGILTRHGVDIKDWALACIKACSGRGWVHPSLLRMLCLYAAACVPPAATLGTGGSDTVVGTAETFTMTPILPTEIAAILADVDWGLVDTDQRDEFFAGLPPPPPLPHLPAISWGTSSVPVSRLVSEVELVGEGGLAWEKDGDALSGPAMQDGNASCKGDEAMVRHGVIDGGVMPALLATCFALYYSHCIAKRNSPFPGPFRYDMRELPLTRMLRFTAAAAAVAGSTTGRGGCLYQSLTSIHAFMLPAAMDACPELFRPEGNRSNRLECGDGGGVAGRPGTVFAATGATAKVSNPLEPGFVRRAMRALPTSVSAAIDVLRALSSCPTATLLSSGEMALKQAFPKVSAGDFPQRSAVASLCSSIWVRLHDVHPTPQSVEAWTLNLFLQRDPDTGLTRAVPYDTMCQEPLLVFRCVGEALSCPYLLRILLRILRSLMLASERVIDRALVVKQRHWEMVSASERRKNQKAAQEAYAAAAASAAAAAAAAANANNPGSAAPPPPPQPPEDMEEKTAHVDGSMMIQIQQTIVARCLMVIALAGRAQNSGGGGGGEGGSGGPFAPRAQVCRLVCDFLQTMISESPALLHLLFRQMLPTDALVLLLDGVPACRGVARHLADVMTQQSWEARAFGVRAAALLALRFPTEEAYQACRDALYVLGSMCDIEARPPRNLANALGEGGMGHGVGGGIPTSAALLSCGLPSSDLVKDTFGYVFHLCKAFPSLTTEALGLIESILKGQDLGKMFGVKGAARLRKRLSRIAGAVRASQGSGTGNAGVKPPPSDPQSVDTKRSRVD